MTEFGDYSGWLVFLDVYGFKAMMKESSTSVLTSKLNSCHSVVEKKIDWNGNGPINFFIQDSIFLFYPVDEENDKYLMLQKCITDVENIMDIYYKDNLPLRGGIGYGDITYSKNTIIGDVLIRVLEYESEILAPLVFLPASEYVDKIENGKEYFSVAVPIPKTIKLKSGIRYGTMLLPSPTDGFKDFVCEKCKETALNGPAKVAEAWKQAYDYICKDMSCKEGD